MPKTMHEKHQRTFFPLSVVLLCAAVFVVCIHIATDTIPQYLDFKDMQGTILYQEYGPNYTYRMDMFNAEMGKAIDTYGGNSFSNNGSLEFQYNVNNPNEIYVRNYDEIRIFTIGGKNTLANSYDWYQLPLACKMDGEKLDREAYLKSVPGKNAISYKIENSLVVYDIDTQERTTIAFPDVDDDMDSVFDAEWLDSETLIYDKFHWINDSRTEHETHLYKYNIRTKEKTLFIENVSGFGISFNRRYLCYDSWSEKERGAKIMDLETGEVREVAFRGGAAKVTWTDGGTGEKHIEYQANIFGWSGNSSIKPSSDGKYILCYSGVSKKVPDRHVMIVNVETGRWKLLSQMHQGAPTTLDWKE